MDPTLYDEIRNLSDSITDNHVEVCQRLTALETRVTLSAPLTDRVAALENWRNYILGALSIIGLCGMAAVTWIKAHLR